MVLSGVNRARVAKQIAKRQISSPKTLNVPSCKPFSSPATKLTSPSMPLEKAFNHSSPNNPGSPSQDIVAPIQETDHPKHSSNADESEKEVLERDAKKSPARPQAKQISRKEELALLLKKQKELDRDGLVQKILNTRISRQTPQQPQGSPPSGTSDVTANTTPVASSGVSSPRTSRPLSPIEFRKKYRTNIEREKFLKACDVALSLQNGDNNHSDDITWLLS